MCLCVCGCVGVGVGACMCVCLCVWVSGCMCLACVRRKITKEEMERRQSEETRFRQTDLRLN